MYSRQSKGRKGPTVKSKRGHRHGKRPAPQVGEYVQWTSDGVDQFKPARKVTQIQDRYVWVDGSQTGIPLSEVTVVEPPAIAKLPDLLRNRLGFRQRRRYVGRMSPRLGCRPLSSFIEQCLVEDHADHALGTFKTQREAIDWAKKQAHSPLVAHVRHLNDRRSLTTGDRQKARFCPRGRRTRQGSAERSPTIYHRR